MTSSSGRKFPFAPSRLTRDLKIKYKASVVVGVPLLILVGYLALAGFAVNPSIASAQSAYDNTIRAENEAHDAESDLGQILVKLAQPLGSTPHATTGRQTVMAALADIRAERIDITANVRNLQSLSDHHPRAIAMAGALSGQLSSVLSKLAALTSDVASLSGSTGPSTGSSHSSVSLPGPVRHLLAGVFGGITSAESTVRRFISNENGIMSNAKATLAARHDAGGSVSLAAVLIAIIGGVVVMLIISSGVSKRLTAIEMASLRLHKGEELTDLPVGKDEIGQIAAGLKEASQELRHREKSLRDQRDEILDRERLISSIFEAVPDIITLRDTAGKVIRVSPEVERSLGITMDRARELMCNFQHVLPEDRRPSLELQATTIASPRTASLPMRVRARGKTGEVKTYEIRCRPLTSKDGRVVGTVTAARDISDQVTKEDELKSAKQEADKANQAKSEFLSRMSHELRTPLNSILGFSQLIKMDEIPDQIREYVVQIEKGGKHLLSLINEVLDLARVEAGRLSLSIEPVMVVPSIREAMDIISPLAFTSNVSLAFNRNDVGNYLAVKADSQRLMQVLLNLLDNAIKYNIKGGSVMVNLEQQQCDRGRTVRISVVDTGRGIPANALEAIFTPFTRLSADSTSIPGTGIGLALTRRLVEAMGGTITVTSEPAKGSTFCVEVSVNESTASAGSNENPAGDPMEAGITSGSQAADAVLDSGNAGTEMQPAGSPESAATGSEAERLFTVLYIEDNVASARLMEEILSKRPSIRLIPAALGRLGIDIARQYHPDLILLDLHLEDMSGEDVLREITAGGDLSGTPVVIVSADATPGSLERLISQGACRYMTKPVDVHAMLKMVDTFRSQASDRASHGQATYSPEPQADDLPSRSSTWRHYGIAPAQENDGGQPSA
ncbi:MAG: ATP-binding protein [Actinobacteria bacterium]|nr:ATP-binding protein [Actinomycetota bacterium]MCL5446403.1 ATP-binding protein [Actinomycetota bacterium]